MKSDEPKLRMILKFDVGRQGFDRMIWVLALTAVGVLALGIYFFLYVFPQMLP